MRKESPEEIAQSLVKAICLTFQMLQEEQNSLFLELGYSAQDRIALSLTLTETVYRTGLLGYPKRKLHQYMSEGELQSVLYQLVCGDTEERIVEQTTKRLLQRPDFQYATTLRRGRKEEASAQTETRDHVPSLSERDRASRRGSDAPRTRRPRGRTGRDYDSPMH